MTGLYIHIPFCKQACRYCDFYFTVTVRHMDELVECLVREMEQRKYEIEGEVLNSLYLGGGTPSLLGPRHLEKILSAVHRLFPFTEDPEITLECNPDDLNRETLDFLYLSGINRLSIGVQSFHPKELQLMRRSHSSDQAYQSILEAAEAGFDNITIDLIYGIPGQTMKEWASNLKRAISTPIAHLAAYHLTFEPGTVFEHWRKKGKIHQVSEETSIEQFKLLRKMTAAAGMEHYEISNFAREKKYSLHNLLYWSGEPYMGVGPSAHSYDGSIRRWNIASLKKYVERIKLGQPFSESERLTPRERYHDTLITSLRTSRGLDPAMLEQRCGPSIRQFFDQKAASFLEEGILVQTGNNVVIHPEHWLIADHVFRELFMDSLDDKDN
jgi:oxygen-independent coproporphyrinogen-3 oxidase